MKNIKSQTQPHDKETQKSQLETIEEQTVRILNNDSLGLSLDERYKLVRELIKNKVDEILKKYSKNINN